LCKQTKFLIISGGSFLIIVGVYELVIRRVNLLRVASGMKPVAK
jgi:hypothetical protein